MKTALNDLAFPVSSAACLMGILMLTITANSYADAGAKGRGGFEDEGLVLPTPQRLNEALPVQIRIDADAEGHPVRRELLGTNQNWYWSELIAGMPDNRINPEFVETLQGVPMPLSRMSGNLSQMFNWKYSIGPTDERTPQTVRHFDKVPKVFHYGPLEWVDSMQQIDPEGSFVWVLNLAEDSPEDHGDLAELFRGIPGENRNGGKDWAQVRVDYGIEEPVDIFVWELGNELEHDRWEVSYEQYRDWCRAAIDAIREVDPDARFAALAATSPWRPTRDPNVDWRDWHRNVLRDFGDDIDYITFHPYYHGINAVRMTMYMDEIQKDIVEMTGPDRIKMYISEHARWPGRTEPTARHPRGQLIAEQTHSLEGTLATAEFFNLTYNDPMVAAMGYHSLSGGPWHMIWSDPETNRQYLTAIADLFRLYDDVLGETVVPTEVTGEQADVTNQDLSFSTLAMRDGDTLTLVMTNRDPAYGRSAAVDLDGGYDIVSCRVLTAPSVDSVNTLNERPVRVIEAPTESLDLGELYVPPRCVMVLGLQPTKK